MQIRYSRFFREAMLKLNRSAAFIPMAGYGHPCIPFSLANAHLFLPYLGFTWRRIHGRIINTLKYGRARPKESIGRDHFPELWLNSEFAGCLDPASMETVGLYSLPHLKRFFDQSRNEIFRYRKQLARIFTLERTLRLVRGRLTN
jgi:hypothetical protein